jgi:selenocysteine lyase/cysteine desulfurase
VAPDDVVLTTGPKAALGALLASHAPATPDDVVTVGSVLPELDAAVVATAARLQRRVERVGPDDSIPAHGLVVIPTVDASTGALLPVEELCDRAHAAGSRVVVDATFSAGAIPLTHAELGPDALLLDGHRWLLGPEGIGALWLGPGLDVAAARRAVDLPPRRTLLGLARSVSWLLMYVGLPWAEARARALAARLAGRLAQIERVELGASGDRLAALVTFRIQGWSGDELADELEHRAQAIVGRDPDRGWVRASVGAWNQEDELDRFAEACAELARYTPATLPRRSAFVLLGQDR